MARPPEVDVAVMMPVGPGEDYADTVASIRRWTTPNRLILRAVGCG